MRIFVSLVLLLVCVAIPASAQTPANQYLIDGGGRGLPAQLAQNVERAGGVLQAAYPSLNIAVAWSTEPKFAERLAAGGVKNVTRDYRVQFAPAKAPEAVPFQAQVLSGENPTDAFFYACQWNLDQIDAPAAWSAGFLGDPSVVVAVLDTGIDSYHVDLAGKVDLEMSESFVTDSPCGDADTGTIDDYNFHGTFVAGQITSNNFGIAAVAPRTTVAAIKVLDCAGSGSFSDTIMGLMHAVENGADIVNMSFVAGFPKSVPGGGRLVGALSRAVNYATAKGIPVFAASGNSGAAMDADRNVTWIPAQAGSAISIYATANTDTLASYSNYGRSGTWVGAPGGDFPNTLPRRSGCSINTSLQGMVLGPCSSFVCGGTNFYVVGDGTSMASPVAAGVAALVEAKTGGVNAGQMMTILANTADDLGLPGTDAFYSHGRVNAARAVGVEP